MLMLNVRRDKSKYVDVYPSTYPHISYFQHIGNTSIYEIELCGS